MKYLAFLLIISAKTTAEASKPSIHGLQSGYETRVDQNTTWLLRNLDSRSFDTGLWTGSKDGIGDVINVHYHIHEQVWDDAESCIATGKECVPGGSLECCDELGSPDKSLCNAVLKKCVKCTPALGDRCSTEFDTCCDTGKDDQETICLTRLEDANKTRKKLFCQRLPCVSKIGGTCDTKKKCCNTLACRGGKCASASSTPGCKYPGGPCDRREQCCQSDKNVCRLTKKDDYGEPTGVCGACSKTAGPCKTSIDCCLATDRCSGNSNVPRSCFPCAGVTGINHVCQMHSDCCPGKDCRQGMCKVCKVRGTPCKTANECCASSPYCRNGKCNTCVSNTYGDALNKYDRSGCVTDSDCCTIAATCVKSKSGKTYCKDSDDCKGHKGTKCVLQIKGCCRGCECKNYGSKGSECWCKRRG